MTTDLKELQAECLRELERRGYSPSYLNKILNQWDKLEKWMIDNGHDNFTEDLARIYCEETFGFYFLPPNSSNTQRDNLRAIRMLTSFQKCEDFEVRCPRPVSPLVGPFSDMATEYLLYLANKLARKRGTIEQKRRRLILFLTFINNKKRRDVDLSISDIDEFLKTEGARKAGLYDCVGDLKQFLRYLFERKAIKEDLAAILPKMPRKAKKLPTTYSENEIRKMIDSVDRSSAIGKRNYLVLLLAAEYGLRASDIVALKFGNIDWDANLVTVRTMKTGSIVKLPLLSTVGNAVADYAKNGRPETNSSCIILSHNKTSMGKPLNRGTIHSIVAQYLRQANIENWQSKKHGPHALRFSLATRLQRQNTSTPVISQVLGHQSITTTQKYINIDMASLGKCPLPMPPLNSPHYTKEGHHAKL